MVSVEIDTSELDRLLEESPKRAMKVVKATYRKAGSKAAAVIRQGTDRRFRRMVGYKVGRPKLDMTTSAAVGIYKSKGKLLTGKSRSEWYALYWRTYGTLANRDPLHEFSKPRQRRSRTWKGGIKPSREFEPLIAPAAQVFCKTVEVELPKQFEKEFEQ